MEWLYGGAPVAPQATILVMLSMFLTLMIVLGVGYAYWMILYKYWQGYQLHKIALQMEKDFEIWKWSNLESIEIIESNEL
jgi:hypothetical protein